MALQGAQENPDKPAILRGGQQEDPYLHYEVPAIPTPGKTVNSREGNRELTGDPRVYSNDFLQGCKTTQEGRTVPQFTLLGPQDVHRQTREAGPLPHTICKTELKIKHLSES